MFFFVCLIAAAAGLTVAWMTRGITFTSCNSDLGLQVNAAANAGKWKWPSDMHKYAKSKARIKDVGVLMLVLMQRLLGDRKTAYPVIMVSNLANSVSAVLIFLVAETYWNQEVGLLLFVLYLTCFWPFMIVLYGGYQVVAQMWVLMAVYCAQQAEFSSFSNIWYVASGVSFGLMLFASASSRKFIPLYLAALLFSQRSLMEPLWFLELSKNSNIEGGGLVNISIIVLLLGFVLGINWGYSPLIKAIYFDHLPGWGNRLIGGKLLQAKHERSLEEYLQRAKVYVQDVTYITSFVVILLIFYAVIFPSNISYIALFCSFLGFMGSIIFLTYPDIRANLLGLHFYWTMNRWGDHHSIHKAYYLRRVGHVMDNSEGGLRWDIRFFWRMIPFHFGYYGMSLGWLVYTVLTDRQLEIFPFILLVLLSVSGVIWGRLTKGPQVAQAYFPVFLGFLAPIAHACFLVERNLNNTSLFWLSLMGVVLVGIGWNVKEFIRDVWPSRMAVAWLKDKLDTLCISKFYTYKTRFNNPFVDVLEFQYPDRYDIHCIEQLENVREGYVVVPPTSANSVDFESVAEAQKGNFNSDPLLQELIDSKKISKCAVASFNTAGTSKYWVHLSDDMSYRDLLFGDITDYDRWRSLGWLLDAKKFQPYV